MANINTSYLTVGDDTLILQDADLRRKKVNSFQSTPDNNHYPSEKLVKDSLDEKLNSSEKGANNGVASLDSAGKVPSSQLPTIPDVSTKYDTGDTSETTLDDADYFPFYDNSASAKRKSLWSNIKAKLKTYFDSIYLTSHQDITGKADKVSNPTNGNFAALDANGNLTDSGHKHSDYLTSHQNISGKADKVSNPTNGNFAALDANGNLTDSGHKHSDYITSLKSAGLGHAYCDTAASTAAKVATLSNYKLGEGSIVTVFFLYANTASNATLNINGAGAKAIYYRGAAISNSIIKDEDICEFVYYDSKYHLITIDRWNSDFDGNYNNLTNKPTIPDAQVQANWNETNSSSKAFIQNKPTIPAAQIQADWNQTDNTALDFIKNKPTIPSGGGGLSNYDLSFSTLSNNTTSITFEANLQCYKRMTMTAGATLNFAVLNKGCNYLRIYNSSASDITVVVGTVTYNGTAVTTKWGPDDAITVKAGKGVEIGIAADATEADITVSGTLKTL